MISQQDHSPYTTTGGILTDPAKHLLVSAVEKQVAKFYIIKR
jgi:hypothetical protein